MPKKKVVCVHLLNDFSGSPLVFSTAIKGMIAHGYTVDLIKANKEEGFLSHLETKNRYFMYHFSSNIYMRLMLYCISQLHLFFMMFKYINQPIVVYVNTLLPAGAALAARLMNKKVVYHIHETSINPPVFKSALRWVASHCADTVIYVSSFLAEKERIEKVQNHIVHNALSNDFMDRASLFNPSGKNKAPFTVLMICSLKEYKGVYDFLDLASTLPNLQFEIVLNATKDEIKKAFQNIEIATNVCIHPVQSNVHVFYERAHLVLNLSHPDKWIETFGMTLLEAMSYGIPVVAPPVGGVLEFVEDQNNGFLCSVHHKDKLAQAISVLSTDKGLYNRLSSNAKEKSKLFDEQAMQFRINSILDGLN